MTAYLFVYVDSDLHSDLTDLTGKKEKKKSRGGSEGEQGAQTGRMRAPQEVGRRAPATGHSQEPPACPGVWLPLPTHFCQTRNLPIFPKLY